MGAWWVWVLAGIAMAALEVVVPGYVFLGFAIGAVATGGLVWLGVLGGSLGFGLAVFGGLSLLAWVGLRRALGARSTDVKIWERDINE